MKIAAVVILYNPAGAVIANIQSYYEYVDKILVYDNSEKESFITSALLKLSKIEYYQDYENKGVAKRLNEGCQKAIADGFSWLLTMDQDSAFTPEMIAGYINCFRSYSGKENVAMFGVEHNKDLQLMPACTSAATDKLITSGSLLNLNLFNVLKGFDEALFIDAVDYDYCLRARMKEYPIIKFTNICLQHYVGRQVYRSSIKTFFLLKKKKEIHSPFRCYYMYRNMLYLKDKYGNEHKEFYKQIRGYVLARIKICLLYGRETFMILKYLQKAKADFKKGKMGKIQT